ncbi:MAG: CUB domain-containing protein, partial [Candidatus Helarchaeota archaeon]
MKLNKRIKHIIIIIVSANLILQPILISSYSGLLFQIMDRNTALHSNEIQIFNIVQTPNKPTMDDDVVIEARITSTENITIVRLYYTINDGPIAYIDMNLKSGSILDGIWRGIISKQPYGTNVSYYIYAENINSEMKKAGVFKYTVSMSETYLNINITRTPLHPKSSEDVKINVSINLISGVKSVDLFYGINSSVMNITVNMSLKEGDIYDGVWNGTIPGEPNGTIIKYYIKIVDMDNNEIYIPNNAPYNYYGYWVGVNDTKGPVVQQVSLNLAKPNYDDTVKVRASINMSDEVSGLKNATIHYSVNNGNLTYANMRYKGSSFGSGGSTNNFSNIRILGLLNKTYSGSKDYCGLYSFTDDLVGSDPENWTVDQPANTNVEVVSQIGNHKKVVELVDNSINGYPYIINYFDAPKISGTAEFWFRGTDLTDTIYIMIRRDGTEVIGFRIYWNNIYWNVGGSTHFITTINNNEWYWFRVKWNGTGWMVIINGVEYGTGYTYQFNQPIESGVNNIIFHHRVGGYGYTIYVDAVDYSWAPGYYEGRILDYNIITQDQEWFDILTKDGNYTVDQINISKVIENISIADSYNMLLIGDLTIGLNWNVTEAEIIANLSKPIIARGRGGAGFIFALGLNYTDYSDNILYNTQIFPSEKENHLVLNSPYDLPLSFAVDSNTSRYVCKFNTSDPNFEKIGYAGSIAWNNVNFGHYKPPLNDKILYWGMSHDFYYDNITTDAKHFCINMVEFLIRITYGANISYSILNFEYEFPKFSFNDTISYNITAYDYEGNSYTSPTYNFTIGDDISPQIGVYQNPEHPDISQNVQISVNAQEPINASGIKNITLYYNSTETAYVAIDSPHLVPNNYDYTWNISAPNCSRIELFFKNITLEENFDYLYIYNYSYDLVSQITGSQSDLKIIVNGNTTRIHLVTDFIGNSWGFSLTCLKFYYIIQKVPMNLSNGNNFNGTWTAIIPKQTNISYVLYYCQAFDYAGNDIYSSIYQYISAERVAPNILEVSQVPNRSFLNTSESPIITVHASDSESGIRQSSVILQYTNGGHWNNLTMNPKFPDEFVNDGYWNISLPVFSDGKKITYRIIVKDLINNTVISNNYTYIIDGSPPQLQKLSLSPSKPQYNDTIMVKCALTDLYSSFHGSGINSVYIEFHYPIDYVIESSHPYINKFNRTWTISYPSASGLKVFFSKIQLASGDSIQIYNGNNNLIQTYTGTVSNTYSPRVNTDIIKIRLITDSSNTDYGFLISHYVVYKKVSAQLFTGTIYNGTWVGNIPPNSYGITINYDVIVSDAAGNT